jgi:DNA-binding CsgD family transcriptional regulator
MTIALETPPSRQSAPTANWSMAGISALLATAATDVLMMSTSGAPSTCPIGSIRRVDYENVRRGVRYRLLVPDSARTIPRLASQLVSLGLAGASIRTVPAVPMDALVIDGSVAVLPAGPTDVTPAIATLHLPSIVKTTTELFERVWADGVPLAPLDLPLSTELSDKHLRLLSLLYSGSTDEAAAAQLAISVRTVRRMVSDITNRLGARSRFQAGAKAAQRGWIPGEVGR